MANLIALSGWLLAVAACLGCAYGIAATIIAGSFLARRRSPLESYPAVTVLKPLHGIYPGMESVLEGFCDQDYPAPVQIVFGVQDSADPAIRVVEALRRRRPMADIALVIDSTLHGSNRKISNVINIADAARHEVLILSDADIAVPGDYLRQVTAALADDGVGAVTCVYVGADGGSAWSRLGAMGVSYGFFPNAVFGKSLNLAEPCFGSTIALRSDTLAAMGGFHKFRDHLADDFEIGRATRELGHKIAIPPVVVTHMGHDRSLADLWDHEVRWGRTVRQINPHGYAGSVITNPLPLAMIAAALLGFTLAAWMLILLCVGVRVACKFAMDGLTGASAGRWWMIPARDVLSFGVFIASFAVNTVGWHGRRFRVGRDGVLSHSEV